MKEFRLESLLVRRLLIVSGKGGVGKTTVAIALALLAVQRGKRVILAEINSEEQVARLLERPPVGYNPTELLPGLWGVNILPKKSFEEYVLLQIRFQSLYKAVFENRFVRRFIEGTPGLSDLMCIGKVYALVKDYDLVIVDAPATGHGIALLSIPSIVANAVRIGPLKSEAEKIDLLLHDPEKTQVVLVTLPEEMPVAETLDLIRDLEEKLGLPLGPLFLNGVQDSPFTAGERKKLLEYRKEKIGADPFWTRIELEMSRAELTEEYSARLKESAPDRTILQIPFLYSPRFGLAEVQTIAQKIEKAIEKEGAKREPR